MADFSNYQKDVIRRYYDNRDQIDEQKLSELVGNIYLESGKKLEKLWKSAEEIMTRSKVPKSRIAHVINSQDPALLAEVVADIQAGKI